MLYLFQGFQYSAACAWILCLSALLWGEGLPVKSGTWGELYIMDLARCLGH
jgi:hypothetical protein